MSVRQTSVEKNLALLDIDDSHFSFITEGDTQDDNPVWSKPKEDYIL